MCPIATSLSPNTESDDIVIAWKILFQPWLWRDTDIISQVEQQLSRHLNHYPVALTSSGRSALYLLLQAYGIGKGDEVIVQAFTCLAVPAPIKWAGAIPVYADIDPQNYNFDPNDVRRKITPATRAIIVQHTFGLPGPVDELKQLTKQHNLVLIEDCAHALGATYHGQPVGTLGDAAFFSFGRDKTLSSVFGGAISSSHADLMQEINHLQKQLEKPPLVWIKQQLLHPILLNLILPVYFRADLGKVLLVVFQKMGFLSKAVEPQEKLGYQPRHINYHYPGALAYLLDNQLAKLEHYTAHRRRTAHTYLTSLASHSGLPHPLGDTQPSWLRFPLLVANPGYLQSQAKKNHVLLGDWYNSPLAPSDGDAQSFDYQPGSCPRAEAAAKKIINLPTHPRLNDQDTHQVIKLISQA